MAIRAVTGILQGLAAEDANAAIVGGLSPYANKLIKEQTKDNKTANLMAHAVLGAIEAKATKNNALAGATGAVSAEVTAKLITEKLYNKPVSELTEQQKEIVSILSQATAGLAGGIVGGSKKDAVSSAEIGKRAVENNLLTRKKSIELADYADEFDKKGKLSENKLERSSKLIGEDFYTNYLIQENQRDSNNLNPHQKDYLHNKLSEIALEMSNDDKRLSYEEALKSLYEWNFNKPQIGGYYPALMDKIKEYNGKMDMFENKAGISTLEAAAVIGNAPLSLGKTVWGGVRQVTTNVTRKGINFAKKYPKLAETFITGSIDTGYDVYNGEFTSEKMGLNYVKAGVTAGKSLSQRLSIGMGTTLLLSGNDPNKSDKEFFGDMIGNVGSTLIGDKLGKVLSKTKLSTPVKQTFTDILSKEAENKIKYRINQQEK